MGSFESVEPTTPMPFATAAGGYCFRGGFIPNGGAVGHRSHTVSVRQQAGFWSYCGLGIVMRSSSDWVRTRGGEWIKAPVQQTRGLNRNFNRTLKHIFKGAARFENWRSALR